jgi:hypothetical protein
MKELDFLPPSLPRAASRGIRRLGALLAISVVLATVVSLHALRAVRISSAQTHGEAARPVPGEDGLRHVIWTLPTSRMTQDTELDTVLAATLAAEGESLLVETFKAQYASTLVEIRLHAEERPADQSDTSITDLLSANDLRPLSAELLGFAATDLEIGMLVGRLSACPFTTGVQLMDTSEARFNDRRMRSFRIGLNFGGRRE